MTAEVAESVKSFRVDLRATPFVTIDDEDARDFDDAVYCEPKKGSGWRLFVAIADVSNYVKPGSALNQEAVNRGTPVYFPGHVIPILPEVLSNGLCSLNPEVDRLAMVCEMTTSAKGKISGYRFYESVIRSHARLTYNKVWAIWCNHQEKPFFSFEPCVCCSTSFRSRRAGERAREPQSFLLLAPGWFTMGSLFLISLIQAMLLSQTRIAC